MRFKPLVPISNPANGSACFTTGPLFSDCTPIEILAAPNLTYSLYATVRLVYSSRIPFSKGMYAYNLNSTALSIDVLRCPPGFEENGDIGCQSCPAGKYQPGSSRVCMQCRPGFYSANISSSSCKPCAGSGGISSRYIVQHTG